MKAPKGWYAIATAEQLKDRRPLALTCLGNDLVIWKARDGKLVAMYDRCPHRSAQLSQGSITQDGCAIACPFHGFEFASDGHCRLIPETGASAANLGVNTIPVEEKHGFIWLWHGDSKPDTDLPWFESLKEQNYSYSHHVEEWPMHVSRCVENQLDYAHLPYVHRNTIGGNVDVRQPVKFVVSDESITFYPSGQAQGQGYIEFRFPNIWMLTIVPNRFAQVMAFVPVTETRTVLHLRSYQAFCVLPGLDLLVNLAIGLQSRYILNQDRRVVLSQSPNNSLNATDEKLFASDRAVGEFRKWWNSLTADQIL